MDGMATATLFAHRIVTRSEDDGRPVMRTSHSHWISAILCRSRIASDDSRHGDRWDDPLMADTYRLTAGRSLAAGGIERDKNQ